MRITVHLDTFDHADPSTYAILWLDKDTRQWSREGHAVIELPDWGVLECTREATKVLPPAGHRVLCVLDGLDLVSTIGPFEGESGRALWYRHLHHAPVEGHWHVQWIDETQSEPESGVFADDET